MIRSVRLNSSSDALSDVWILRHTFENLKGMVALGYPLFGQGKREKYRGDVLKELDADHRILFVSGTKDRMMDSATLEKLTAEMQCETKTLWIQGADHGLKVGKRNEKSMEEVQQMVIEEIRHFCFG